MPLGVSAQYDRANMVQQVVGVDGLTQDHRAASPLCRDGSQVRALCCHREDRNISTYARDDAKSRIRITARVTLHAADLIAIVDRQLSEGAWQFGLLYDLRAVSSATPRADVSVVADHV